ncbi:MAG TPA: ribose 5-phosphate isomerase B [Thermoanaerobaculaceae bacterium]|nr:ribose 5-phosphate isomerase B [Thermoanaerobaculaceae bacterium]
MRVAIGADHAGYELKATLAKLIRDLGHDLIDVGTDGPAPVDYPDFAAAVGLAVREQRVDRGVLVCGSGVGASVAANKIPGVRAGICHDAYSAHQGVEHDDMNVLVLGARIVGVALASELAQTFLAARFSAAERHVRRLAKVRTLEEHFATVLAGSLGRRS